MAKPIRQIRRTESTPEERQAEALADLIKAISENRSAILDTLEILGHLHEMGALTAVKSLLAQRHEVGVIAIQQLNQPKMHNTVKNLITAAQSLGNIRPDQLQKMLQGVANGLEASKNATVDGHAPTLWELARTVRDPTFRSSMATMLGLVKGMGEALHDDSPHVP